MRGKYGRLKPYIKYIPALLTALVVLTMVISTHTAGVLNLERDYERGKIQPYALISDVTVTATPCIPTTANVVMSAASGVTDTDAQLNAEIVSAGCCTVNVSWRWDTSDKGETDNWTFTGNVTDQVAGIISHSITGTLSPSTLYYAKIKAVNCNGTSWSNTVNFTTTAAAILPPTDIVLTDLGATTINGTWTKGANSVQTIVVFSRTHYPTSITDGEMTYNGTAETTLFEDFDIENTTWYTSWWGADGATLSSTYTTAQIGGSTMAWVALFALVGIATFASLRNRDNMLIALGAMISWLFVLGYSRTTTFPGLTAGDAVDTMLMLICVAVGLALPIMCFFSRRNSRSLLNRGYIKDESGQISYQSTTDMRERQGPTDLSKMSPTEYQQWLRGRMRRNRR